MEPTPAITTAGRAASRLGMGAIVVMAAGFGWVGGNFTTSTDTVLVKVAIALGHLIFPLALALLAGLLFASPASAAARRGVTVVAWLSVLFVVVSTGYALANPDPDAFGPHSFADYTAIVILLVGAVLWLLQRFIPGAVAGQSGRGAAGHRPAAQRGAAS